MKAISLWQPWATLIAIGAKRIETRDWDWSYRGPLAIHASKGGLPKYRFTDVCIQPEILEALQNFNVNVSQIPRGAIVATCELCGTFQVAERTIWPEGFVHIPPDEPERSFGDYRVGRWAWVLQAIRRLPTPIPFNGKQGPFEVPDELLRPQ